MTRLRIVLGTTLAAAVAWILLWPVADAGCLPTGGPLACEIGARSFAGPALGVPLGDTQVAVLVIAAVVATGALVALRTVRPRGRRIDLLAAGSAVLGLALIAAIAFEIGVGGNPDDVTNLAVLVGAVMIGAGVAALVAARAARRRVPGRAMLAVGGVGVVTLGLALLLTRVELIGRGGATYVPLDPDAISFSWPVAATFVLMPAVGSTGLALVLASLASAVVLAVRRARRRA